MHDKSLCYRFLKQLSQVILNNKGADSAVNEAALTKSENAETNRISNLGSSVLRRCN